MNKEEAQEMINNSIFYAILNQNQPRSLYYTVEQWARKIIAKNDELKGLRND